MHASQDNGAGDDDFKFIIIGKGVVLLSWRHQIDTSYPQHALSTGICYGFIFEKQRREFSPVPNLGSNNKLQ